MDLHQTMKGLKIQNIEKVIYHPTDWISGLEYEENDDNLNDPDMPKTKAGDYNTGYYKYRGQIKL